jgi:hypothetical protein
MVDAFPEQYPAYRVRTKMLVSLRLLSFAELCEDAILGRGQRCEANAGRSTQGITERGRLPITTRSTTWPRS